ncbi:MAG: DUF1841 family protein [Hydrogenophilales bacterium]|nr:DUF1841 family protein [Hydrogenophilales bacterium]
MYNPTRDQARNFLFEAWRKYRRKLLLSDLESLATGHILAHPEYHGLLDDAESNLDRDWLPELGETNPFLHLAMHLAISEQLSIDQPGGLKSAYARLCVRLGDEHRAQHAVMDCLAETIWRAQRDGTPPDGAAYIDCLEKAHG